MKRGVAIALGASAMVHAAVLVVLDGIEPPPRPPRPAKAGLGRAPIELTAVPIEVSMVVLPAAAAAPAPPGAAVSGAAPGASRTRVATAPAAGIEPTAASATSGVTVEPTGPGRLSMRHLGHPDLTPSRQRLTVADDPDAPPPWTPPAPSGELEPTGGGRHLTDRPGFTGKVAPDGRVTFKDKPAFSIEVAVPHPVDLVKGIAGDLERWYEDPYATVRMAERDPISGLEVGDYTRPAGADDGPDHATATLPLLRGRSEITDYVMRKVGMDPYQSDKLRWMAATREERGEISRVHRRRQLEQVDHLIRRHLDTLWARADLDLAAKRAALFELWDDGAEDGDAAVVEAASRSRAHVIGFVRAHLPAASPGAYTAPELAALNRRRTSRARFAPY